MAEPEEHFFLRVTGDSMINAGIRDGDLVLLRRQDTAENGHRLIGIISHVEDVKGRLPRRIEVTKQPAGGSAAVIR